METDPVNFSQRSETQDECSSKAGTNRDSQFTKDRKTQDELKGQDTESTCGTERSESLPQPHGAHAFLPADGAVKPNMEALSNVVENDPHSDQAQEWPPVPEPEDETQSERKECQYKGKENTETIEDILTPVSDDECVEPVNITQIDVITNSPTVASEEEGCAVECESESRDDSDSIVFLSENSEEQNTDYKPTATTISEFGINAQNIQQEELEVNKPSSLNKNEVVEQVCGDAPPLDTIVGEPANPEQDSPACSSNEVKEPLIMTEAKRDGERENGERCETGEERKQTVCFTETGGPEEERQAEVEDQRQERENKGLGKAETRSNTKPHLGEGKVSRMDGVDHFDDSQSDSGVSADFSPNSTTDVSDCPVNTDAPQLSESPPNETPIEREIRLAMQREQSLRRSRGLDDTTDRTNEFVEIPVRRPILSQELQFKPSPSQGKDRLFAGKKMQMEISAEAEREKVLVELGRLPGFYDKGTEVQIQEKKLLFEAFQEPKESVPTLTGRSNSQEECAAGIQEVDSATDVRECLKQFSLNSPSPPAVSEPGGPNSNPPSSARGPGLTEGTKAQIIIIETTPIPTAVGDSNGSNGVRNTASWTDGGPKSVVNSASVRSSAESVRTSQNLEVIEDKDDADSSLVKENPFFKLRSSMSLQPQVEQDIKEAKERERELQRQRNSLYGGAALEPEAERTTEIDSWTGEREKEEGKVEEKTTSTSKEILSPPPQQTNLTPTAHQSEVFSTTTSVRQSTGKLDLTWPPPQADEEQKQQLEKTLRTPRQRNPLLDRWESGMVNGHVENSE